MQTSSHKQPLLCVLQIFTQRELSQLDVYGTWAVIRNRLHTDDSFEFNKTLKGIKDSIEHLPDATQEEEEALQAVKVSHQRSIPKPKPCDIASLAACYLYSFLVCMAYSYLSA